MTRAPSAFARSPVPSVEAPSTTRISQSRGSRAKSVELADWAAARKLWSTCPIDADSFSVGTMRVERTSGRRAGDSLKPRGRLDRSSEGPDGGTLPSHEVLGNVPNDRRQGEPCVGGHRVGTPRGPGAP